MKTRVFTLIIAAFLAASTASAQTVQPKSLFSAGGQLMASGIYEINGNVGDVISGISMAPGGSTIVEHGFWAGNVHQLLDVNDRPRVTMVDFLGQAQPNPARGSLTIEFGAAQEARASLEIFDLQGRRQKRLVHGPLHAGVYRTNWDLRDESGRSVAVGIYLYRLQLDSFIATGKLAVIR
ncbi:MAG: T9SS type A sorting domain-containing protein [Candidatus Kerfeldbacteria bacterium]|nr:T9SS type A sorting domain-containing protein [Candidatus Kerfeldbacteria bacterium]